MVLIIFRSMSRSLTETTSGPDFRDNHSKEESLDRQMLFVIRGESKVLVQKGVSVCCLRMSSKTETYHSNLDHQVERTL